MLLTLLEQGYVALCRNSYCVQKAMLTTVLPKQETHVRCVKGTSHTLEAVNMFKYFAEQDMSLTKGYQNLCNILFHL